MTDANVSHARCTTNTQSLALQDTEIERLYEAEVIHGGGEADLHRRYHKCRKNPGHHEFIPVDIFTKDHLPHGCRKDDLLDCIRALSDLTVRVKVSYVSERRPTTNPGSYIPYPCNNDKNKDAVRIGTGWISCVYFKNTSCECRECRISLKPKPKHAEIHIRSAAHVVFDHLEGAHTTCHLFYDKGSTLNDCDSVYPLSGMSNVWSDIERDTCKMSYITHDLVLANRLDSMCRRYLDLHEKVSKKLLTFGSNRPLTVIVSHPHGCSKQISLGYYTRRVKVGVNWSQYTYTTATCPGSSGALVFVLGRAWWGFQQCDHPHKGNCSENNKLNFSGHGID